MMACRVRNHICRDILSYISRALRMQLIPAAKKRHAQCRCMNESSSVVRTRTLVPFLPKGCCCCCLTNLPLTPAPLHPASAQSWSASGCTPPYSSTSSSSTSSSSSKMAHLEHTTRANIRYTHVHILVGAVLVCMRCRKASQEG
jgi:hypothetical protein